ncbi:vitamin B12 dependent-methionine synthase activation domain-containing protein [Ethanoligenens harbinense]|uniref:Vitamin B12 dependent methionine synthase activation region n=1 Tax=Ethanoligenens harbinense (strain DSM 18485 / JCM 12961 / CGMCC 1.5033 / YUAN-3) TaxID=663278 RepID=E6U6U8_ETHHY|nr:vitamin B12 dependent-methionine synthase activation domain-containing protein [Ethanoligenens harbinense]ADU26915.1 Vitamin B12 dependent methionine synthase activation region [Ethanoligenens harbinense YUAN-3]AVQ96011.1 Vitamin B12 dependent methionine synthase activation subunit [Ethanoligenens harbinense YUAN-3]AYF38672.1 Vitamin B12 dependent methionine synthase activation subunit [Ethanoligenens harbinense]AYF41419.1 Vitamin B12 dependent methionine synthase activation subunit [Ethanol
MLEIRQKEVLRYLGYRGQPADESVLKKIRQCSELLLESAAPRMVSASYPLTLEVGDVVAIGTMRVTSHILWNHLRGCTEAVLFAATLGPGPDVLLRRYAQVDVSTMVILQACAAELIERYCDVCEETIREESAERGLFLRPRFSPGYGDFDIRHQRDFIERLACSKRIGLTMTEGYVLAPSKSVTAVIGLTPEQQSCHTEKCASCSKMDCVFRRG